MTINYEITEADLFALTRFHARQPKNRRQTILAMSIAYFLGLVVLALQLRHFVMWLGLAVFLAAVCALIYSRQAELNTMTTRTLLKRGAYKGILGNGRIELSADGMRAVGPIADSLFFWNAVEKVRETDEHIFVSFSESLYFLIPKRAFATPADGAAFLRRIEELRAGHGAPLETISRGSWWTQGPSVTETETQTLRG